MNLHLNVRRPGLLDANGVDDFGDRFIPAREENAGDVSACFVVQHDEIDPPFEPTENSLPV